MSGPAGGSAPASAPAQPVSVLNVANYLTVLRILLVPLVLWLLLAGGHTGVALRVGAFLAFAAASITDRIDGELARSRGLVTDFGKLADPIADKLLLGGTLVALAVLGEVAWWVVVVIEVRELGITALRFAVKRYGVIAASPGGKLKTVLQIVAVGLYLLPWRVWLHGAALTAVLDVLLALLLVAVLATVVTGVDYLVRAARLVRESRTAAP